MQSLVPVTQQNGAQNMTLAPTAAGRPQALTLQEKMQYAKLLSDANLLHKQYHGNPGNVLMVMELGQALHIEPVVALLNMHIIEGKPSCSAWLAAALIRRAGHSLDIDGDDKSATCVIVRKDGKRYSVTWTHDMADKAGLLGKDNWRKYKPDMLKSRALLTCSRMADSGALCGVFHSPDELGSATWSESGGILEVGVVVDDTDLPPGQEPKRQYAQINTGAPVPVKTPEPAPQPEAEKPKRTRRPAEKPADPEPEPQPEPTPEPQPEHDALAQKALSLFNVNSTGDHEEDFGDEPASAELQDYALSLCRIKWPEKETMVACAKKFLTEHGFSCGIKNATMNQIQGICAALETELGDQVPAQEEAPF